MRDDARMEAASWKQLWSHSDVDCVSDAEIQDHKHITPSQAANAGCAVTTRTWQTRPNIYLEEKRVR